MRNNALIIMFILSLTLVSTGCGKDKNQDSTYNVGGMVSGLSGTVVLQNNGENDLSITSNGTFTFSASFTGGSTYAVTILTQPAGQTCSVANGSGTISDKHVTDVMVSCYNSGTLDPTFGNDGAVFHNGAAGGDRNDRGNSITTDSFGRILVTGYSDSSTDSDMVIWRYNNNGTLDTTFGNGGIVVNDNAAGGGRSDIGNSITVDSSGRILVTGYSDSSTDSDMVIWRYNNNGTLDTTFGNGGIVVHDNAAGGNDDDRGNSIIIDSSGRILVTGDSGSDTAAYDMVIWRYNADGTLDTTFGNGGVVVHNSAAEGDSFDRGNSIAIDSNGRILVAGYSYSSTDSDMVIWRYNTDGTLDSTFGIDGIVVYDSASGGDSHDSGNCIKIDSNGRILVTGVSESSADLEMTIWRYNTDGTLDSTFGNGGIVTDDTAPDEMSIHVGLAITTDASGRILVTGENRILYTSWIVIWRYNTDGSPDTTFGSGGTITHDYVSGYYDKGNSITIDSNGRILMTGAKDIIPDSSDMLIWRVIQ